MSVAGGMASVGAGGVAGAVPSAGQSPVGASPATGGAPSEAEAGSPSDGGGTGETEPTPAIPSPGCALAQAEVPKLGELPNSKVLVNWAVPSGYDGVTPVPLIFVLHATNQYSDSRQLDPEPSITQSYLVAGPQAPSPSGTFETGDNTLDATGSVEVILREVLATACVDEARMFAVGNGSGGRQLVRWMGTRDRAGRTPRFRAAAIIGAYYGKVSWQPLPLLFMHALHSSYGARVAQDADGMKAFASLAAASACGTALTPVTTPNVVACKTAGGMFINPGCGDVADCAEPLRFCHHDTVDDNSYDAWPCFGPAAIAQFFDLYRY